MKSVPTYKCMHRLSDIRLSWDCNNEHIELILVKSIYWMYLVYIFTAYYNMKNIVILQYSTHMCEKNC